jgi:hypothetical protein
MTIVAQIAAGLWIVLRIVKREAKLCKLKTSTRRHEMSAVY